MKKIIFFALMLICSYAVNAQNVIAVQHGGTPTFYTNLDTAIVYAQSGDTIYLPGGFFSLATNISKCLHIIGVGHNPDSTNATGPTIIGASVGTYSYLITGASGGSLIGVKLSGSIDFGTSSANANVSNYTVGRFNITGAISSYSSAPYNNVFYENIIGGIINLDNAQSNAFYNNIIAGNLNYIGIGNIFKNNDFIAGSYAFNLNVVNSTFMNNIFRSSSNTFYSTVTNNVFNNNLFVENITFPSGTNIGSNNIVNQTVTSIFVNQNSATFAYTQDYHLQTGCPGKNAGTDGTDIGIYGGSFPWKTGSLPYNPHVQYQLINGNTNPDGTLPVNIKVGAQNH